MNLKHSLFVLLITAGITLIGNTVKSLRIGAFVSPIEAIPGLLILLAIAYLGIVLAKVIPVKIPAVAYIVTFGMLFTLPACPLSEFINPLVAKVDFLALCTPILAYAGIYAGSNLETLAKSGWRIVVVSIFVMLGTYLGSALIAQGVLMAIGQI
ncbi:MAG: DUF340 domain-containing protein [Coriobacteriia bacterium]|nr:DUF340 domain-containing protein [Coriobacteriia bacterium]